jgi:hypothetical protein
LRLRLEAGTNFRSEFKHPNGSGRGPGKHIILDWPVREGDRLRENECDFWDGFFLDSIVGSRAIRPQLGQT